MDMVETFSQLVINKKDQVGFARSVPIYNSPLSYLLYGHKRVKLKNKAITLIIRKSQPKLKYIGEMP